LLDAYRPVACQQALRNFYWRRFGKDTARADDAALAEHVSHYLSDPRFSDPKHPRTRPAHATGAALDLTLRATKTGELLNMGTRFDDMSTASHRRNFVARYADAAWYGYVPAPARRGLGDSALVSTHIEA
jgi:D-alanyl-D-alanine dipeptidase